MEFPDLKGLVTKPRATFESLLETVNLKKGIAVWFLFSIGGLLLFLLLSSVADTSYTMIDFGFGAGFYSFRSLAFSFGFTVVFSFASFILFHIGAKIVRGAGTFRQTIGLLGYANIVSAVQAVFSGLITLLFSFFVQQNVKSVLLNGTVSAGGFAGLIYIALISTRIFQLWAIWLYSGAVSASHQIARWKSLLVTAVIVFSVEAVRIFLLKL